MNLTPTASKTSFRLGVVLTIATSLFLAVTSAGVGIIGADGDPANLMYGAVLLVVVISALIVRFRPIGMAGTMVAAAFMQAVITTIALVRGLGQPYSPPLEVIGINGGFIVMWIGAAWLFRKAAHQSSTKGVV